MWPRLARHITSGILSQLVAMTTPVGKCLGYIKCSVLTDGIALRTVQLVEVIEDASYYG